MSKECDRAHAQVLESTTSFTSDLHMPRVKNITTSRPQCQIHSSSSLSPMLLESPFAPSTSPAMITNASLDLNADSNQSNIDHITSLERSLCSNFVCCGVQLADFHALLEHFEEDHILVLAPNGKRIYPPQGLQSAPMHTTPNPTAKRVPTPTPVSSRSSSVTPSEPAPPTPASSSSSSPSDFSNPASGPFGSVKRKSSNAIASVYTPFTLSLPVDPADPYSDSTDIALVMAQDDPVYSELYPSFSTTEPVLTDISGLSSISSEDEEMSDAVSHGDFDTPMSPILTYVSGLDKRPITEIPKSVRFSKGAVVGNRRKVSGASASTSTSKSSKARGRYGSTGGAIRRREKSYKCPTSGCTKSYLNPNGLKYHLEKGTCKFDDDCEADPDHSTSDDPNAGQMTRIYASASISIAPTSSLAPPSSSPSYTLPPVPTAEPENAPQNAPSCHHDPSCVQARDTLTSPHDVHAHTPGTPRESPIPTSPNCPLNFNARPNRDAGAQEHALSTRLAEPGPGGPAEDGGQRAGVSPGYCHPLGEERSLSSSSGPPSGQALGEIPMVSSPGQVRQRPQEVQVPSSSAATSQIQPITAPTMLTDPLPSLPHPYPQENNALSSTPSQDQTPTPATTSVYQYHYPPSSACAHNYALAYAQRVAYYAAGSASPAPAPPVAMVGSSSASARSQ